MGAQDMPPSCVTTSLGDESAEVSASRARPSPINADGLPRREPQASQPAAPSPATRPVAIDAVSR